MLPGWSSSLAGGSQIHRRGVDCQAPNWTNALPFMRAQMSRLTSKGIANFCQAKSDGFGNFQAPKQHIFWNAAATAAIGDVNVPIGGLNVVAGRVTKGARGAIDLRGAAFEFEECACGCFIEVQWASGAEAE